ncbi:ammonium transporter [Acinetobacter baumannii]|uniref:Ammonium transporter n=1 Tax=Acinetobacter junii TaxID=40215 RepID=A0AAW5R855_ACIJU|nr:MULTISPECIES: ammonium transporter [Acinetobacter]AYX85266.1 ammonium transporter [Acinetobacter baumannii]MBF9262564.1 ammonium transporter [Acinetobacter baumannii]MCB5210325.1 ammonium transporter [Acinetobacter baumannii]MCG5776553.1 ammonium transporter [Acinetobacter baumannii]MCG5784365.1 ammonium transporter [Acinetobacter baumannii]
MNPSKLQRLCIISIMLIPSLCFASETEMDKASTVWMIISSLLVLLMCIPGLALFYGGMVREKNVLSIITQFMGIAAVVSVLWTAFVYSMTADTTGMEAGLYNIGSFVGGFDKAFLIGIDEFTLVSGVPEYVLFIFGLAFAIITPCIAIGGFAERMKFSAVILFSVLWLIIVYAPINHMVWSGSGALFHNWGVLDFAGGTAIHINSGVAALVGAYVLGRRHGWPKTAMPPHNVIFTFMGMAFLWLGWFGFNVGSALAINDSAIVAFVTTMLATCTGILGWMVVEKLKTGHVTGLGLASGAIGGLVGITPACAFVGPLGALLIGFISAIGCYYAITVLKKKLGIDDALDVFALHGIGGIIGCVLTGIFCIPALGGKVADVSVIPQVCAQIASVIVTILYSGILTWIIMKIIDKTIGLRASPESEHRGLDLSDHNERAYNH